jgi:hypothetical protein
MPPSPAGRGRRSSSTSGQPEGAGQPARRRPAARRQADQEQEDVLRTLTQAMGARSFEPRGEADDKPLTRSFQLVVGVVERAKATADGIQHRTYDTALEGKVPGSLSALVTEALNVACSYYEDILNGGHEFRRVRQLTPGPSAEGAVRGARKRAEARQAKA